MNTLLKRLEVYQLLVSNSFLQRYTYRSGVWMQIVDGVLYVFMLGSLWTALIRTGYAGATLKEMISFVVINALMNYVTYFNAASNISNRVQDGSIATDLILPINFKWKLFFENIGNNFFDVIFSGISGLVVAVILYGAAAPAGFWQFLAFLLTVAFGILISYQIIYLFGLSAFWVIKPWYITFLVGALTKLFGGIVIPLWLYPDWLVTISNLLPFRFISYEPIQIYLGNYDGLQSLKCVMMQALWILLLLLIEKAIWIKASKKIFVQGG
jgi:ABC-2 type transport system permease protein